MGRFTIVIALAASLAACGKKDKDKPAAGATGSAAAPGAAGSAAAGSNAMAAPTPPAGEAGIDVCAWVPKEEVAKLLGGELAKDPETLKKMGAQLGGCTWETKDVTIATVTPRPAHEFDGTVKVSGDAKDIPGIGEKATETSKAGLLVKVAGKPYFLHVMVIAGAKGMDNAKAAEVAKLVVPAAK